MRRILLASLAALALTVPARADFIKNAADWQRLGPEGQAAYAMAIFDVQTVITADNKNIDVLQVIKNVSTKYTGPNIPVVIEALKKALIAGQ